MRHLFVFYQEKRRKTTLLIEHVSKGTVRNRCYLYNSHPCCTSKGSINVDAVQWISNWNLELCIAESRCLSIAHVAGKLDVCVTINKQKKKKNKNKWCRHGVTTSKLTVRRLSNVWPVSRRSGQTDMHSVSNQFKWTHIIHEHHFVVIYVALPLDPHQRKCLHCIGKSLNCVRDFELNGCFLKIKKKIRWRLRSLCVAGKRLAKQK